MKTTRILAAKALLPLVAALAVISNPVAHAESQYGYSPSGAAGVTATARVNIQVNVPTLILLRVGPATGIPTLTFAATPGVNTAPTAATLGGLAGDTSNAAADWDGTLPTFTAPTTQTLRAYAWTNSAGGGQLGMTTTVNTILGGITPADITVTAVGVSGALPAHPANTAGTTVGSFARNVLHSADWTYGISAATLAGAAAGSYEQQTVYTATAL